MRSYKKRFCKLKRIDTGKYRKKNIAWEKFVDKNILN